MIRGRDTTRGEAGYCPTCHQHVAEGPDACIGTLPGVLEACCGHGDERRLYVTLLGEPCRVLRGEAARYYLHTHTTPAISTLERR